MLHLGPRSFPALPPLPFLLAVLPLLCAGLARPACGQAAGSRYVLIVGGLGGDPHYTESFSSYVSETHALFVDRYGVPDERVYVLAEESLADRSFVDDVSTAENIRAYFGRISRELTTDDHVYVFLFGHGSFDGTRAAVNIPRRDLDDADYAELIDGLPAGRIVFVNTTSASGPFARTLSGENRVIITATATGTERDETVFPRFLIEALSSPAADLDKDGDLSMREVFTFAAQQASRSFEESGHLATEHALLEDNGDGEPARIDELESADDGHLASVTYVRSSAAVAQVDPSARPLLREKESLERSIAELKSRKGTMSEDAYYDGLETLFIQLARLNDRIEDEH